MNQGLGVERATSWPENWVWGRDRASSRRKTVSEVMFSLVLLPCTALYSKLKIKP